MGRQQDLALEGFVNSPPLPPVADLIPHRGNFLLIDRLVALEPNRVEALANFSALQVEGHYPGHPVVPGVLLLEGLAQTLCCGCVGLGVVPDGHPYLAGLDKVRFRAPVVPPAEVRFVVNILPQRLGIYRAEGEVWLGDKCVASASLSATIVPGDSEATQ